MFSLQLDICCRKFLNPFLRAWKTFQFPENVSLCWCKISNFSLKSLFACSFSIFINTKLNFSKKFTTKLYSFNQHSTKSLLINLKIVELESLQDVLIYPTRSFSTVLKLRWSRKNSNKLLQWMFKTLSHWAGPY